RGRVMVKELLGFARRSSLDLQPMHLGDLVADLQGFLRRILPADVEIVIAGADDLPEVRADIHAAEQTLLNLATNARDAMPVVGAEVAAAGRDVARPADAPRGWETILVVEDDDPLRRSAKRILEDAGYQVLTAADGLEALDVLRQGAAVRLVFSDLVMPRLGGRALYDAARRDGHTVPFLFASGYSDPSGRGAAALDPSVPLLHKPWTGPDLLGRVRQLLDRP